MGLAFIGFIPGLQREYKIHTAPKWGVAGAPLLGIVFGIGWSPCIGPTLAAVQSLAFAEASAARGAFLSFVYCLGLGLPFVLLALAFSRMAGAIGWIKRHYVWVMRIGGGMLIIVGLLLVTGLWTEFTVWLRVTMPSFQTPL
jgi:cytochrome c-type biogenesis protein